MLPNLTVLCNIMGAWQVKGPLLDICNDCSPKNIKGITHKKTLEICEKSKSVTLGGV